MLEAPEVEALLLSLKVVGAGVVFAFLPAFCLAYLLARKSFPGKPLVEGLVHLPLVLPPVVMGYLLLLVFGVKGVIGGWMLDTLGLRFTFSWVGAALATAIVTLPFQVRALRQALESLQTDLEDMARTLGAGFWDRLCSITFPLIYPSAAAGLVTAFSAGLGQFGAIITFVANIPGETRTLPLAIYTAIQTPGGEQAAARMSALAIGLALLGLWLSEWLAARARARLRE